MEGQLDKSQMMVISAVALANSLGAVAIVVVSQDGCLAHSMSKYRPRNVILAVTSDQRVARQCHLHRGILPVLYSPSMFIYNL